MGDYIKILLSLCISVLYIVVAFRNLSPYKLSIKKYTLMSALIIVCVSALYPINQKAATLPIYIIPIIFIYLESNRVLKSIVLAVFMYVVIAVMDNLGGMAMLYIFGEKAIYSTVGHFITSFIIILMIYAATKLIQIIYSRYKSFITENIKSKYFILMSIVIVITFILFYFNINWNTSSDSIYLIRVNAVIFISYGIIMSLICILLLFFIKKEANFKYNQMQLKNLKEYTDNLERLYTDMRKFRHDYINIISTMAGFIENKDLDALEKHFNQYIYPLNSRINNNNYKLGLLKNICIPEIKGLVSGKVIHAQETGADVVLDITEPIEFINMNIIDLSRAVGIIMDNAIEAAVKSEEKKINIAFIKKNNSVIIVVINTFAGDIPPISKMFKQGFSTKGENRGLGLSNLKEIVNKYDNISLDTSIDNGTFCQEIIVNN